MTDMILNQTTELQGADVAGLLTQTMQLMQGMADMIRMTNERMANLERQVANMEKVTPTQAADLNRGIRARAQRLCEEYRVPDEAQPAVAAAIRKEVRTSTGARSMRDIARCDYKAVLEGISTWDDYRAIKAIKARGGRAHG